MRNRNFLVSVIFILVSVAGYSQGFYLKPTFSYGFALSKQEIRNDGSLNNIYIQRNYGTDTYVQSGDYKETVLNGARTDLYETVHKERVPLGKGKIIALEIGYESRKCLFYGIAFSYGMMDKYTTRSFYDQTYIVTSDKKYSNVRTLVEKEQTVSPIWYGIEPSIGLYKNMGKYKLTLNSSVFLGLCRVRLVEITRTESISEYNGVVEKNNFGNSINNVYTGGLHARGSLEVGIEKKITEKTTLGLFAEYRSQIYSPTKLTKKYDANYYHLLGSVIPVSSDKEPLTTQLPINSRRDYLFESLSFGISWKRYLFINKSKNETLNYLYEK